MRVRTRAVSPGAAWLLALCCALPAAAAPRLRIVVVSTTKTDGLALAAMADEVRAILGPVGAELTWVQGDAATVTAPDALRVVLLSGRGGGSDTGRSVLGSVIPGSEANTLWVYYANVVSGLGLPVEGLATAPPQSRRRVGVALGRVVTHEIVHTLAPELHHESVGLMAARMARFLFRYPHVALDARTVEHLRERVALWPRRAEPPAEGTQHFTGP
jgi:hypothetical protein